MGGRTPYGIPRSERAMKRFHGLYLEEDRGYETPCWQWTGTITSYGYAYFCADGLQCRALRFAYTHFVGEIPSGLTIDHLCRNQACVNPCHLEAVSRAENSRRAQAAIRAAKTHCVNGHPWVPENLLREGIRQFCAICRRSKKLAAYHARKAADRCGQREGCRHRRAFA